MYTALQGISGLLDSSSVCAVALHTIKWDASVCQHLLAAATLYCLANVW